MSEKQRFLALSSNQVGKTTENKDVKTSIVSGLVGSLSTQN
jgi:hypothetical protein